jgi:hypothetical protein
MWTARIHYYPVAPTVYLDGCEVPADALLAEKLRAMN